MHRYCKWAWLCVGLASIGLVSLAAADGPTDLGNDKIKKYQAIRPSELLPLIKGVRVVQDGDKKNIELAAEVLVWRVSWPVINTNNKIMDEVRKQFDQEMSALLDKENRDKNKDFRKLYAKYLVDCFKEVFKLPFDENRVGCVNAAILLPKLARLQEQEVGDFLTELVRDPKMHDAVKLYALKGLAVYFPAGEWTVGPAPPNGNAASKKRDIERISALLEFLERKWEPSKAEDDAVRFVRREAIKTLGQAQVPAVEVAKLKAVAPVASGLLRILDPTSDITPTPSLLEKVEAAIGICQIKLDPNTMYLPDTGIYQVGKFLVEFANEYKRDKITFGGKGGKIPKINWKIQSERLQQALKQQVNNLAVSETAQKNAKVLADAAFPYLNAMKTHADMDNPKELGAVVGSMQPKNAGIFKGIRADNGK